MFAQFYWQFCVVLGFIILEISHNKHVKQCERFPQTPSV